MDLIKLDTLRKKKRLITLYRIILIKNIYIYYVGNTESEGNVQAVIEHISVGDIFDLIA